MRISTIATLWVSLTIATQLAAESATPPTQPTQPVETKEVKPAETTPSPAVPIETKTVPANEVATTPKIPQAVTDALNRVIKKEAGTFSIKSGPINGLYETVVGSDVIYVTADGNHIVVGDIRETNTGKNLTDARRGELRMSVLNQISESEMIVFAPEKETKHTVNVFTDVDCPYCSKFHNEVSKLNAAGVKVRYLAFPRAGVDSKTYNKMVAVWCADNQQQAMTDAKAGRDVPEKKCNHPVDKQYNLSQKMGVTGTPALILSDGELLPGYVPAEQLINYLQQKFLPFLGEGKSLEKAK
jgi:thiol:disulfide interchange protein DsbC